MSSALSSNFIRAYPNGERLSAPGLWLIWQGQGVIMSTQGLPSGAHVLLDLIDDSRVLHLGALNTQPVFAVQLPEETALPAGHRALGLRDLHGRLSDEHYALAGYSAQLLLWQKQANYCMVCGNPLAQIIGEWGKKCASCGYTIYPPVSPCTITLIHAGERMLMTHKDGWGTRFGLVAGFVEPGESLEECLVREVREEVGVEVSEISYFRSQPWPYPHQVMCGYFAKYVSGEIRLDPNELDDARWFHVDEILSGTPTIPPPLSIARQLIDHWVLGLRGRKP